MTRKVIFLDVDGVLNCLETKNRIGHFIGLDPVLVARFNDIVRELPDVEVVLSSTWRLYPEMKDELCEQIAVVDCTPSPKTFKYVKRGREIALWLEAHPEVERYAIIDDDVDLERGQMVNAFITSFDTGLTEEIAERVVEHFNAQ